MATGDKATGARRRTGPKSTDTPAPGTAANTPETVAEATAAPDGGAAARREQLEAASAAAPPEHDTMGDVDPAQTTAGLVGVAPPAVAPDSSDVPMPGPAAPTTGADSTVPPVDPGAPDEDPPGDGKWVLFNPTDGPVVYDDEAHIVGGGERVQVDVIPRNSPAQRAIDMGLLVKSKAPAGG